MLCARPPASVARFSNSKTLTVSRKSLPRSTTSTSRGKASGEARHASPGCRPCRCLPGCAVSRYTLMSPLLSSPAAEAEAGLWQELRHTAAPSTPFFLKGFPLQGHGFGFWWWFFKHKLINFSIMRTLLAVDYHYSVQGDTNNCSQADESLQPMKGSSAPLTGEAVGPQERGSRPLPRSGVCDPACGGLPPQRPPLCPNAHLSIPSRAAFPAGQVVPLRPCHLPLP